MIYLLNTTYYNKETKEVIDLLKIGYTKDIDKRLDTYLLHNPGCRLLDIREGDVELENYFHKYYSKFKYPSREEWFYYNQEIIDNFQTLQLVKGKILTKEEYIEGLKKYLKSLVSTTNQLKFKYLSTIIKESKEKYPKEYNEDIKKAIIDNILNIWEVYYNENISLINSFDYDILDSELIFTPDNKVNLGENPWKNFVKLFYKTISNYRKTIKENFESVLKNKVNLTESLMRAYNSAKLIEDKKSIAEKFRKVAKSYNYKDDYISVDEEFDESGNMKLSPKFNQLIYISEIEAFNTQQLDYENKYNDFINKP